MGELNIKKVQSTQERNRFYLAMLNDVKALDLMIKEGLFEKGTQRIGSEQELCLIKADASPDDCGPELLAAINEEHFTTELAKYNLEINLDPAVLHNKCFTETESQLRNLLNYGKSKAKDFGSRILLCGVLPTISREHLAFDYMTPIPRYKTLSDILSDLRGKKFDINFQGVDELITSLDTVLFEACNTSFQLHLQIEPQDFVAQYNWSQAISGPVLSAATYSPLLFGKELWYESRISLFKQSLDTRNSEHHFRSKSPRVSFGNDWIRNSAADIFKENISRFPLLLTMDLPDNALEMVKAGNAPSLKAMRLHNGTTYTWNRPCYGRADNVAHLRIECRYIPSGPTIVDEMANFAFWIGLMKAMPEQYEKMWEHETFSVAKGNFFRAARYGMHTSFDWFGKSIPADRLILETLLPMASKGLEAANVDTSEISKYLGIIHDRVCGKNSGSDWMIRNFRALKKQVAPNEALPILTEYMHANQETEIPVHNWPDIDAKKVTAVTEKEVRIAQVMSTDIFTVNQSDPVALVKAIMDWNKLSHVPVEDNNGNLLGLFSRTDLEKVDEKLTIISVGTLMTRELITVDKTVRISDAAQLMEDKNIHCLPVLFDGKLIGILTDTDVKKVLEKQVG